MSQAAARLNWRVERLSSWRVPEELCDTGVAIYGEPLFVTVVAGPLGTDVLDPSENWLPDVPGEYLRRWVRLSTLGEARQVTSPTFIKPVADKCFDAKVYAQGAELPPASDLDDSEHVLMSEPVVWEIEFRAFVMDRKVVTLSPYLRHGELVEQPDGSWAAEPDEVSAAEAFCKAVLSDSHLSVPPAFVLDVGIIADHGWAVIEANPAWGSGLYGCDPEEVLRVVRRACIPRGQVHAVDVQWVRKSDVLDTD
jgi:hypothetical protein